MKKKLFIVHDSLFMIAAAIVAAAAVGSCDKVPLNGDLDGMWQLMNIQPGGRMPLGRGLCS